MIAWAVKSPGIIKEVKMTYHPKTVYHEQGSTKFVCSSGGEIEVLSGGLVDLKGKLELVSGAELELPPGF